MSWSLIVSEGREGKKWEFNLNYYLVFVLSLKLNIFTTWGRSPQVVPKIVFTHVRSIYIYLYVTLTFLLYTLYWRNNKL